MSQVPATVGKGLGKGRGPNSGLTRGQQNKAIRQKALREQLSAQGHVQHVNDIAQKLGNLEEELDPVQITRLVKTAEIKLKLINKYLPDLKATEISGKLETAPKQVTEEELRLVHRLREAKNAQ